MEYENSEIVSAVIYIFTAFFLMSLAILIFVYYSRKKIIQQEIVNRDMQIEHQKKLLKAEILSQENERNRISQDLHDDISSGLNVVSLNCHLLKSPGLTETEHHQLTDTILTLTNKVLENARRIAHDLLPPIIDKFGLDAGIKELVEELNKTKKVKITYNNSLDLNTLEVSKHLHIFRILQELINNSMRHGKATEIKIEMGFRHPMRILEYTDNGIGFDIEKHENQKGLGMKNIESRVAYLDSTYTISSEINKGVEVKIQF